MGIEPGSWAGSNGAGGYNHIDTIFSKDATILDLIKPATTLNTVNSWISCGRAVKDRMGTQ